MVDVGHSSELAGRTLRQFERDIGFPELAAKASSAFDLVESKEWQSASDQFRSVMFDFKLPEEVQEVWLETLSLPYMHSSKIPEGIKHRGSMQIGTRGLVKIMAAGSGWSGSSAVFDFFRDCEQVAFVPGEFMHINGRYGLHGLRFGSAGTMVSEYKPRRSVISRKELLSSIRYCFFGITDVKDRAQEKHAKNARSFVVNGGVEYALAVHGLIKEIVLAGRSRSVIRQLAEPFVDAICRSRIGMDAHFVALDNVLPCYRMEMIDSLDHVRFCGVVRDPRDQFVDNKVSNPNFRKDVRVFAERYQKVRKYLGRYQMKFPVNVRVVQFEEFVWEEKVRRALLAWAGLTESNLKPFRFRAEKSQKNTCLYKTGEYQEDVAWLRENISDYCVGK